MGKAESAERPNKGKPVVVRCYSGVFFGYLVERRGSEVDLVGSRHVYQWKSNGLPRLALTVEDLALIGAGTGTRISGACSQTVLDVKTIVDATPEAVARFEALPCLG
jgi:hypothetical protein